jgi:hypothetical protein
MPVTENSGHMPWNGLAIAQVAFTTVAATAVGAWILGSDSRSLGALHWAVHAAAGFLIVSYSMYALALAGFAKRAPLGALAALLAVMASARIEAYALPPEQRETLQGFLKRRATPVEHIDGRTLYRLAE